MSSRRVVGQIANSGSGNIHPASEYFAADGVETEFTIANAGTIHMVEIGGQIMRPYTDYVINDDTVIFAVAPPNGTEIGIYFFARVRQRSAYTADNTQITGDNTLITADSQ